MKLKQRGKRVLGLLLAGALAFTSFVSTTAELTVQAASEGQYGQQSDIQDGVTLYCWNWSYKNIEANMEKIAKLGYTAIQTSPVQQAVESTNGKKVSMGWVLYYQPVSFSIDDTGASALGTKAEFESMCETAHEYGVKVIVNVVANHMAPGTQNGLSDKIISDLKDDSACWHNFSNDIQIFNSRYHITQHCLSGIPDLNTANEKVQNHVISLLKECIDAGADGFCFESAKYIETPEDSAFYCGSDFWPNVIDAAKSYALSVKGIDLYCYGEIIDNTDDDHSLPISAYTKYMSVTDNQWSNDLRYRVNDNIAELSGLYSYYLDTEASNLVLWAESQDNYIVNNTSSNVSIDNINKTWALVAARADAMGLYFARPNSTDTMLGEADVTGWSYDEVGAVNQFHNLFVGQDEYLSCENGIAYCERGTTGITYCAIEDTGVVLVNCNGGACDINVAAHIMQDGKYKDQITGNIFTVEKGRITGHMGDTGIAVVYGMEVVKNNIAYIKLPSGWENPVYCYAYDSATETKNNGAWPGAVMTKTGEGIYMYEVPEDIEAPRVLFYSSDSNRYPANMEKGLLLEGSMIYEDGEWNIYNPEEKETVTAYIKKPEGWGNNLYCYVYSENNESITNGSWPGEKMTNVSGDIYKYEVSSDIENPLVIFSDGSNQYPEVMQKGLALTENMIYMDGSWTTY